MDIVSCFPSQASGIQSSTYLRSIALKSEEAGVFLHQLPPLTDGEWHLEHELSGSWACAMCGLSMLPGHVERCQMPMVCTGMSAGVLWGGQKGCGWNTSGVYYIMHLPLALLEA